MLSEAISFGIICIVIGNLVGFIIGYLFGTKLPKVCKNWNKNYVMEMSLFFTGFLGLYFFTFFKQHLK